MVTAAEILARLHDDPRALPRLATLVENEHPLGDEALDALYPLTGRAHVVGITGPPGAGKSSLIAALIGEVRAGGREIAVVAVDPSSTVSGGAVLGDRIRMMERFADSGVFVRSMASRGRQGGLAWTTANLVHLLDAAGYPLVIVETVGVGQSETEIADCADLVVLCVQPGSGDALQFAKAGIMEVPDLVLVTKADLGAAAERAAGDVRRALSLAAGDDPPPIAVVSAVSGKGVAPALDAIDAARAATAPRRAVRRAAQARAWVANRLVESFGREGEALLAPRLAGCDSPFGPVATLMNRAREALHESLKEL